MMRHNHLFTSAAVDIHFSVVPDAKVDTHFAVNQLYGGLLDVWLSQEKSFLRAGRNTPRRQIGLEQIAPRTLRLRVNSVCVCVRFSFWRFRRAAIH